MEYGFWNNLQVMRKHYSQSIDRVCQKCGLTRAEMDVLLFLANNPEANRATDIVELRGLTKSHVSIAVRALYDRGLVEAEHDPQDRRVVHLRPTDLAAGIIAQGQEGQRNHLRKLFEGFTPEELEQFRILQEKLFANMKALEDV